MAGVAAVFRPFSGTPRKKGYWMPIFGNNATDPSVAYLTDSLYGHFDPASMALWGLPVPPCIVTRVSIYANGSPAAEVSTLQFGIYDANVGLYSNWPLVATTPPVAIPAGAPVGWWFVDVNIPLAGGFYALSVLDINGPAMTWSAGVRYTDKGNGMAHKNWTGGVFPDPLGICTATTLNYCLYADYILADGVGSYSYNASCCCLPHGHSNMNM